MSDRVLKNIPASIRQRLLNKARADNRPFNELLQYYAMERFLYRLSMSPHSERFILKGALMLRVWQPAEPAVGQQRACLQRMRPARLLAGDVCI